VGAPLPAGLIKPPPPAPPHGKVLAFPKAAALPPPAAPPVAADDDLSEPIALRPPPRRAPEISLPGSPAEEPVASSSRWGWIAIFGLAMVGAALLLRAYVLTEAAVPSAQAPEPSPAPAPISAAPAQVAPPPAPAPPGAPADSAALEDELRGLLPGGRQEVRKDGDLEVALMIELSRMRLPARRVEAPVLAWTGRKKDVPQSADIRVHFDHMGDVDREVAAIGLVVGKYIRLYKLEVGRFEMVIYGLGDSPRGRALDPRRAEDLYLQRISVADFLAEASGGAN
jgi:hypothetical protein